MSKNITLNVKSGEPLNVVKALSDLGIFITKELIEIATIESICFSCKEGCNPRYKITCLTDGINTFLPTGKKDCLYKRHGEEACDCYKWHSDIVYDSLKGTMTVNAEYHGDGTDGQLEGIRLRLH